jgi:lipopolysaccharide/colanic/teichoic acid biosynthesis glycosyltransferase
MAQSQKRKSRMLMPTEAQARISPATPKTTTGNGAATTYDWVATYESWQRHVRSAEDTACTETSVRDRIRRAINCLLAAVALIVSMPLMILIGVLIKLTSPGPILYTQARVGIDRRRPGTGPEDGRRVVDYGGSLFRIYKFRTMYLSPSDAPQQWARQDDPRVTPIGRFLRKYRLDELPQLYNVLCGEMNVVGPRPEQPRIFAMLRDQIENYELRQRVLPGITGLAQVRQNYDTSTEDVRRKVNFDLEYISRRSAGEDLRIMLLTLPAVLKKRGW